MSEIMYPLLLVVIARFTTTTHWSDHFISFYGIFLGFPCGSAGKESACSVGDLDLIPLLGRSPGEGKGYPLHYSGLENSMECVVHGVAKSWTRLSDFHFTSLHDPLEKRMVTHSSILAWRIP